jgi:hypothetical protein
MSKKTGGSGCGCISLIATCLFVWALIFGVTIDGKHYGMNGCDSDKGVVIDKGDSK